MKYKEKYVFNYKSIAKFILGAGVVFILVALSFYLYETRVKYEAKKETNKILPPGTYVNLEADEAYNVFFIQNKFYPYVKYIGPTGPNNEYPYKYELSNVPYIYKIIKYDDGSIVKFNVSPNIILSKRPLITAKDVYDMVPSLIKAYEIFANDTFIKEAPKNNLLPLDDLINKANYYDRKYISNKTKYERIEWLKNGIGAPRDAGDYRFIFEGETNAKYIITLLPEYYNLKHKTLLYLGIVLLSTIIFKILDNIANWYKEHRYYRTSLHYHLRKCCNPNNFLKPYNKEKINISSEIYNQILNTSVNDLKCLKDIQKDIFERLGVTPIDLDELAILKDKCNPQRFTNPFNKEKLELANEYYSILCSPNLTTEEYFDVLEKSKNL